MTWWQLIAFIERHIEAVQMAHPSNQSILRAMLYPPGEHVKLTPSLLRRLLHHPVHHKRLDMMEKN